jgi:hypothetical protein
MDNLTIVQLGHLLYFDMVQVDHGSTGNTGTVELLKLLEALEILGPL